MSGSVIARNNVKVFGQGTRQIIFAHGFGCDQNMWSYVVPEFESDFRIALFDFVGSGRSNLAAYDRERYSSLDGYARDLIEVLDAIGFTEAIFVGHSVSAMIGVLASIERPDLISNLVLVGPSARYLNDPPAYVGGFERADLEGLLELMDKNYIGWANYLAPVIMGNPEQPEFSGILRDSFCSTDPVIARKFAEATFFADNREDLPKVLIPALIMQCSEDVIAPESAGKFVASEIANSTYVKLDATGHCPQVSHPEETARIIRGYLA